MVDLVPELLEKIQKDFSDSYNNSETILALLEKMKSGQADYTDAQQYALEVSDLLSAAFGKYISAADMPDGKMYYNIAKRLLEPTLGSNFNLIADYSEQVQIALNQQARIGLKAVRPELNQNRIDGIVNKISNADDFEDVNWLLRDPIANFCQSIVDDSIEKNCELQYDAGLSPKIVRRAESRCCKWCSNLEGTYDYAPDMDRTIFQRHENCRCTVTYRPGDGRIQNVHSKRWQNSAQRNQMIENNKVLGSTKKGPAL